MSTGNRNKDKKAKWPAQARVATGAKTMTSTHHPVKMPSGSRKKSRKA